MAAATASYHVVLGSVTNQGQEVNSEPVSLLGNWAGGGMWRPKPLSRALRLGCRLNLLSQWPTWLRTSGETGGRGSRTDFR